MRLDDGKFFSVSRALDQSILCKAKFHPRNEFNAAGAKVTAATIEANATSLLFTVNGAAETVIGTYTGNSGADNEIVLADANIAQIQRLINTINGQGVGHPDPTSADYLRRWKAGLADFRPQFVIGAGDALTMVATNALKGRGKDSVDILADSSALASVDMISVGLGVPGTQDGGGQFLPDHFESDIHVTTAGVKTPVRAAGRRLEEQPGRPRFQVMLTDIQVGLVFATTKVCRVYDQFGNIVKEWNLGALLAVPGSGNFGPKNPLVVGPPGSPLWVEVTGTGAATNGTVSVSGYVRAA